MELLFWCKHNIGLKVMGHPEHCNGLEGPNRRFQDYRRAVLDASADDGPDPEIKILRC